MAPDIENELLSNVAVTRRGFVRKVVVGGAFAVPVIASFDMRSVKADAADCLSPNQTGTQSDGTYDLKILNPKRVGKGVDVRIKVLDANSAKNLSRNGRKVRVIGVQPKPKGVGLKLPKYFKYEKSKALGRHYSLKLDTKGWPDGYYDLFTRIGDDSGEFNITVVVGFCG